jgi:hypothetical protein
MEKLIKYIATDNIIRQETTEYREKINTLKDDKKILESFILRYLEHIDQDYIEMTGTGKLIKYESVTKSKINKDIIKQSIFDQIKKENWLDDDNEILKIVEMTYEAMENKREKKSKIALKRIIPRKKKVEK